MAQKHDQGFRKRVARAGNPPNPRGSTLPSKNALNAMALALVERGLRSASILDVPPWKERNVRSR